MEKKHFDKNNIEVIGAHSITEEAFKNLSEESIHENVFPNSNLNEIQVEGPNSIDQIGNDPISDCEKKETETDTFYCNSCHTDDWLYCLCSDYENESKSDQKGGENKTTSDRKAVEISPDLADETIG